MRGEPKVTIPDDARTRAVASIQRYFAEEPDQDTGDLKAGPLLADIARGAGPHQLQLDHRGPAGQQTRAAAGQREVATMSAKKYDFSHERRNPYAKRLKTSVTIRLDAALKYFKDLAAETGIPYQTLINLYLRDCAASGRTLALEWRPLRHGAVCCRRVDRRGGVTASTFPIPSNRGCPP